MMRGLVTQCLVFLTKLLLKDANKLFKLIVLLNWPKLVKFACFVQTLFTQFSMVSFYDVLSNCKFGK